MLIIRPNELFSAKLVSREEVSAGLFRIKFLFKLDNPFGFVAGQYVWVRLQDTTFANEAVNQQAFSIASDDSSTESVDILCGEADNDFNKSLLTLPIGSPVTIIGPFGQFVLETGDMHDSLVFIAGGAYITPFLSLLSACVRQKNLQKVSFIYSNENNGNSLLQSVRTMVEPLVKNTHINVIYNNELTDDSLTKCVMPLLVSRTLFFISGSPQRVQTVATFLIKHGVPQEYLRFDSVYPLLSGEKDVGDNLVRILPDPSDPLGVRTRAMPGEVDFYRLIAEASYSYIVVTDCNGYIVYANKSAEETTGYTLNEMKGNTPRLWGGLMDAQFYHDLWGTIKTKRKEFRGKVQNRHKNGMHYTIMLTISPIIREDGSGDLIGFVAHGDDITERERAEQAKSEFVSIASHQLQTPLSAVKWGAETLLSGDAGPLPPELKEFADMIWENNERMIRVVNSLLNISLIESGNITAIAKSVNIKEILESLVHDLRPKFEAKKINFSVAFGENMPVLFIDPEFLRIIVENFLTNAIKYTPDGGTINLMVAWTSRNGGRLNIRVADSGYGIPLEQQHMLFTKFFRAENIKEKDINGSGLGLHIVKLIVENMGGNIQVDSAEGKGSIFLVSIPANVVENTTT